MKTAKRKNCGEITSSAAISVEHDKNRNGSRLVSVDTITLIYAKLPQPAACFNAAAVTHYCRDWPVSMTKIETAHDWVLSMQLR